MSVTIPNQWMIIAIGIGGDAATLQCSEEIRERVESLSHPGDNFDTNTLPKEPGLYRWSGSYWYEEGGWCGSEPIDADERFTGTFTPLSESES